MPEYTVDQVLTVPANIIQEDGSVILAEIEYDYESKIGGLFTTKQTLTDRFYLRPRRVDLVSRNETSPFTCDHNAPKMRSVLSKHHSIRLGLFSPRFHMLRSLVGFNSH